jgi:hypothetical protein
MLIGFLLVAGESIPTKSDFMTTFIWVWRSFENIANTWSRYICREI